MYTIGYLYAAHASKAHRITSSSVLVLSVSSPVAASCLLCTGVTSAEVLVSESSLNGLCRKVGLCESEVVLDGGPVDRTTPES